MTGKRPFFLPKEQLRCLIPDTTGCYATDRITRDGAPVGLMYREPPDWDGDSGWRFLAGDESDEYLADAENIHIYLVNVIANYSPDIIPHLQSPSGTTLVRGEDGVWTVEPAHP